MIRIEDGKEMGETIRLLRMACKLAQDWVQPRTLLAKCLYTIDDFDEAEVETMKTLSYIHRVRPPQDSVTAYYESEVTGRTHPGNEQELMKLLGDIRRGRLK
jgi:hypothetical protein